jgi:hypothetical protein
MDEKLIRELAEKAGAETWSSAPMEAVTGLTFTEEALKQLVELIVRDAIKVADKHGAYEVMDDLFDHFGVKDEK